MIAGTDGLSVWCPTPDELRACPTPDAREFVRAHTRIGCPPLVPEIRLHLADDPIELWERTEQGGEPRQAPPFWAFAWAGGTALARYVLDHAEVVTGRRVLDLATGSGLVAIAAAKAGAASVTAYDIDPLSAAAADVNATLNGVTVRVTVADLLAGAADSGLPGGGNDTLADGTVADVLDRDGADADVILAGDVFYSRDMAGRVLTFLDRARRGGADVLVGDPGRAYLPRESFEAVAVYDVPVTWALESTDRKRTTVWRLPRDVAGGRTRSSSE